MTGSTTDGGQGSDSPWRRVIPALGVLLVFGAVVKAATAIDGSNGLLEAGIDLVLLSVPGLVMVSVGLWLPRSSIDARYYPRIVAWMAGGVLVMGIVLALRIVHPGVSVQFTFGSQAVLLSIGSIAGLGIGVNKAQALTHARTLKDRNETLSRTEERLEDANSQLEASNERLEQFAYAASHDLQEPLRMVTSYLQLAEQRYGDDFDAECQEFIDFAVDGAERMRAMIDGLLAYSRVETQGSAFETVDLDAVLDDVLTDLQLRIEETDATITRESLPAVEGDGRQLHQLFQNLVGNAMEYSGDAPPEIHVDATANDAGWTVAVHDEGIGIDGDHTDRIFDVFQRLHSVEDHAGSGIGLALSKRIVERHGGEIWAESIPGDGSTFYFTLSAAAERQQGRSSEHTDDPSASPAASERASAAAGVTADVDTDRGRTAACSSKRPSEKDPTETSRNS